MCVRLLLLNVQSSELGASRLIPRHPECLPAATLRALSAWPTHTLLVRRLRSTARAYHCTVYTISISKDSVWTWLGSVSGRGILVVPESTPGANSGQIQ